MKGDLMDLKTCFPHFQTITKIEKGWSNDLKYYIETINQEEYLLRLSPFIEKDRKQKEFAFLQELSELNIPMSHPIDFGVLESLDKVYMLLSWTEGLDLEETIPSLPNDTQYELGLQAGQILALIHSMKPRGIALDWAVYYTKKLERNILKYQSCGIQLEGAEVILAYIKANQSLLKDRPLVSQHGDYHIGNMILKSNTRVSIIDFNRFDIGDPYEEFNRIVFSARKSPAFARGQIDGYFQHQIPSDFFPLLKLYIFNNTLSSIPWAIPFGEEDVWEMLEIGKEVLSWYSNLDSTIPSWYQESK